MSLIQSTRVAVAALAVAMLSACHHASRISTSEVAADPVSGLITKRYDVRHFLAQDFFDLSHELAGTSSGGDPRRAVEYELIKKVQQIQSRTILGIVSHRTGTHSGIPATKDTIVSLPIHEIEPGLFEATATHRQHAEILRVLESLEPLPEAALLHDGT